MPIDNRSGQKGLCIGGGDLLLGLPIWAAQQAANDGQDILPIDVVTTSGLPKGKKRVEDLQGKPFEVRIDGIENGARVTRTDEVPLIDKGFDSANSGNWQTILTGMRGGIYGYVISNVAESFLKPGKDEALPKDRAADSHIGRMIQLLHARFEGKQPVIPIIPVELVGNRNGKELQAAVIVQAQQWGLEPNFIEYMNDTPFAVTLPDRIVSSSGTTNDGRVWVGCEPFAELYIEQPRGWKLPWESKSIKLVDNIQEVRDRKKGLLNVFHTAMTHKWIAEGREPADLTVEQMILRNKEWADNVLAEITNVVEKLVPNPNMDVRGFSASVVDRFLNPALNHRLNDIAAKHSFKLDDRLKWLQSAAKQFGIKTPLFDEVIKDAISLKQTEAGKKAFDAVIDELKTDEVTTARLKALTNSRAGGKGLDSSVTRQQFEDNKLAIIGSTTNEELKIKLAIQDAIAAYSRQISTAAKPHDVTAVTGSKALGTNPIARAV